MRSISVAVWLALLAAGGAMVYATADRLPPRVASHFKFDGFADSYMPREDYHVMILLLIVALPALIVLLGAALPRIAPRMLRMPSRDYWLAPERRDATLARLTASGFALASVVTGFMIGVHLLVVEANSRVPPRLDSFAMWILITALVGSAITVQLLCWRQFRGRR